MAYCVNISKLNSSCTFTTTAIVADALTTNGTTNLTVTIVVNVSTNTNVRSNITNNNNYYYISRPLPSKFGCSGHFYLW